MPDQSLNDLITIALGELQLRVLVLTAEKALLEEGIEVLRRNVAAHRCGTKDSHGLDEPSD